MSDDLDIIQQALQRQRDELERLTAGMPRDVAAEYFERQKAREAALSRVRQEQSIARDALEAIAWADTHYPSMPDGFTGEWKVLRDIADKALTAAGWSLDEEDEAAS